MKFYVRILSAVSKYFGNEDAAILPLAALVFPVVLGLVGLGTDASLWMADKRELQNAADAAAIAAGWEVAMGSEQYIDSVALSEARSNGLILITAAV